MKKFVSCLLSGTLFLGAFFPAAAQKVRPLEPPLGVKAVFAQFERVQALSEGDGVLIQWQMTSETDNAGFNVYRVDKSGKVRINDSLILGAATRLRGKPVNGESYSLFDTTGDLGSMYFVESSGLNGRKISSRYFVAAYTDSLARDSGLPKDVLDVKTHKPTGKIERSQPTLTKGLAQQVQSSQAAPDPTNQRWVVSQPGAKISIRKDGLYRVTRDQLQTAGFDVNTNSANWQLYMQGNEQAIIVGPSDAYIEFLGKAQDTPESDTRVYYLISGPTAGKRIPSRIATRVGPGIAGVSYPQTFLKKDRSSFVQTSPLNPDGGSYYGRVITSSGTSLSFNLSGIDPTSQNAVVTLSMVGFSLSNTLHHSIDIVLNGHDLGNIAGVGQALMSGQFTAPPSDLVEGANTVEMTTATSASLALFDKITISFNRRYVADQNTLSAFTQNYHETTLDGFDSANIRVFDTTYDGAPVLINGLMIGQNNGKYNVEMPSNRAMVLYAVEDSAILPPYSVTANIPSTLSTTNHQADLVIISYSDPGYMSAANAWADFRRAQGVAVEVVDVADIYDEFSYGSLSSVAVADFLRFAHDSWQTAPTYVLFIGDGSYDPRNYEGLGYWDLVPTSLVSTDFGRYASDEVMGDFNGDGLSELRLGRIPARTAQSVTDVLNKTRNFEASTDKWSRGVLFAYDNPIEYDFRSMSDTLANQLPASSAKTFVQGDSSGHATVMSEFDAGKFVVNYSGHGATGFWGNSAFFAVSDVPQLTNLNKESIVTMMSCFNGDFTRPEFDSISEVLIKAQNGGAVVTWASTGETTPPDQMTMATRFFNRLSAGTIPRMGDLVVDAKSALPPNTDVGYTWILLGDPMLQVR
jgi:Peptidase family C25